MPTRQVNDYNLLFHNKLKDIKKIVQDMKEQHKSALGKLKWSDTSQEKNYK